MLNAGARTLHACRVLKTYCGLTYPSVSRMSRIAFILADMMHAPGRVKIVQFVDATTDRVGHLSAENQTRVREAVAANKFSFAFVEPRALAFHPLSLIASKDQTGNQPRVN